MGGILSQAEEGHVKALRLRRLYCRVKTSVAGVQWMGPSPPLVSPKASNWA
jgi:hypothetical protein